MKRIILVLTLLSFWSSASAQASKDAQLVQHLRQVYNGWRQSIAKKNAGSWQRYSSRTSQIKVRNRLWSEKLRFPNAVFSTLPFTPPDIARLKALRVRVNKNTAKSVYFGKIDFGIGGKPSDNLFLISYVRETAGWKVDSTDYINLTLLPKVRKELAAGNMKFVDGKDFIPDGIVPQPDVTIKAPARYIAKVYVYCPGREVNLLVNRTSKHLVQNNRKVEVVLGGARDGLNELQYTIKDIPGGDPKAPMAIRLYLMSEVKGTEPPIPIRYDIKDGSKPKASGTLTFKLDRAMSKKLLGR